MAKDTEKEPAVKPFTDMTELDKMELMLTDLEARKTDLADKIRGYDKAIAEKVEELEALTEERERWAQVSVSTIATADLVRTKIGELKHRQLAQGAPAQ